MARLIIDEADIADEVAKVLTTDPHIRALVTALVIELVNESGVAARLDELSERLDRALHTECRAFQRHLDQLDELELVMLSAAVAGDPVAVELSKRVCDQRDRILGRDSR